MKNIEKEIERLESRHEKSIDELKAILMMAQKEQAPETGKLLQKLIEKRQRAFKNQLKRIEQRRERLRMRKEGERPRGPGRPRKPGEVKEREGWPSSRDLTPEERAERREKWRNMSEQEKEELMAKWRERWKNLSEEEKEKLKAERRSRRDKAEKK